MKTAVILLSLCSIVFTLCTHTHVHNCRCNQGFTAKVDNEGKAGCWGIYLKVIFPCNMTQAPSCKCTGATGIVYDEQGIWCSKKENGKDLANWRCENNEEWENYFKNNANKTVT